MMVDTVQWDIKFNEVKAMKLSLERELHLHANEELLVPKDEPLDVNTAFLNGVIEEEVYIEQPEGFEIFSSESHVCRLKRVLYGLKQAPCAWYTRIDSYFTSLGFTKSEVDPDLYQIVVEGK